MQLGLCKFLCGVNHMKVRDATVSVVMVDGDSTIASAAKIMSQHVTGSVLVKREGEVIGVMTERDILNKVIANGLNPAEAKVKDIMSSPLITIDADASVAEASELMSKRQIRRLIVIDNARIIGKITANSVSRNLKYLTAKKMSSG